MTRKQSAASASRGRRGGGTRALRPAENNNSLATVDRILEGARQVIVRYGYAGFTTRRVAEAASIAPGNLSYHFPSKHELVRALIPQLVADISKQYLTFYSNVNIPPGQMVAGLVRWGLADTVAEGPLYIFRELWTMSLRDPEIRRAVDDLYDELCNAAVQLLRGVSPQADIRQIREFVQVFALISEGCNVLYGTRKARAVPYERIIEITIGLQRMLAPELQQDVVSSGRGTPARRQ